MVKHSSATVPTASPHSGAPLTSRAAGRSFAFTRHPDAAYETR
jgi:hypothetical protein